MSKWNLLYMVQDILSDMDSEEVNTIGDTQESIQVANIVRNTYYNITNNRDFPELQSFLKFIALSDPDFPTHMDMGDGVHDIQSVWYDVSEDQTDPEYKEIIYLEPLDFVSVTQGREDFVIVEDKSAGTRLKIGTDQQPTYYTSFDNKYIVMDSYDKDVDSTLQEQKIRAFGVHIPEFKIEDTFVPKLNANNFPLLLAESKSVAMSLLLGGSDPKIDQAARRQRYRNQAHRNKINQKKGYSSYGRS